MSDFDFTRLDLDQVFNSDEYQDQLPAGPGAQSGCDLNADLNNLFSAVRRILHGPASGVGRWFDAPSVSLSGLHQDVLDLQASSGVMGAAHRVILEPDSNIKKGSEVVIPKGFTYTPSDPALDDYVSLEVRVNGQVWTPGSGVDNQDEQFRDYREVSPSSIVTNRRIRKNRRVDFRIFS